MFRYRVTVEALSPEQQDKKLSFETENHDDLFIVADKISEKFDFGADNTKAFAIGMKLFGEIMLKNRTHPVFETLRPAFGEFMKALKGQVKSEEKK